MNFFSLLLPTTSCSVCDGFLNPLANPFQITPLHQRVLQGFVRSLRRTMLQVDLEEFAGEPVLRIGFRLIGFQFHGVLMEVSDFVPSGPEPGLKFLLLPGRGLIKV